MFYCTSCGADRGWPTDELLRMLSGSYGPCEICKQCRECFDVPSGQLPSTGVLPDGLIGADPLAPRWTRIVWQAIEPADGPVDDDRYMSGTFVVPGWVDYRRADRLVGYLAGRRSTIDLIEVRHSNGRDLVAERDAALADYEAGGGSV
jgi:hypothetical protein